MNELTNHELNKLIQMSKMRKEEHQKRMLKRNSESRFDNKVISDYTTMIEKLERMKNK